MTTLLQQFGGPHLYGGLEFHSKLALFARADFVAELANRVERPAKSEITPTEDAIYRANGSVVNGIAILPINGDIFSKTSWITELYSYYFGATIIENLEKAFGMAASDASVKKILFKVNSGGGQAQGNQGFSDTVFAARGTKPIIAHTDGWNCSAAYYMSSAADEVYSTVDSSIGSIGTVVNLYNYEKMLQELGITETEIYAGISPDKRPDERTEEGRALYQAWVNEAGNRFVATVARNRGIDTKTVLANYGKGFIMQGEKALKAGMVDGLCSFDALFQAMSNDEPLDGFKTQPKTMKNIFQKAWATINGQRVEVEFENKTDVNDTNNDNTPEAEKPDNIVIVPNLEETVATVDTPVETQEETTMENTELAQKLKAAQTKNATSFANSVAAKFTPANRTEITAKVLELHQSLQESDNEAALEEILNALPDAVEIANTSAAIDPQEEGASQENRSPKAEPSAEEEDEILAMTPLGRQVLANRGK
jgi:signal peptide peptidase SppA